MTFTFTRNFPRDIKSEAETLQLLLSTVSTKTAFGQMSFIDDAEDEVARMEIESDPYRETGVTTGSPIGGSGDEIQKLAMNGAQVSAAQGIIQSVADGLLPRDAAVQLMVSAFPAIGIEVVTSMIDSASGFSSSQTGGQLGDA
jgi:hypothetical protein